MLAQVNGDDGVLENQYCAARARHERLAERLKALEASTKATERKTNAQVQSVVDPRAYLPKFFTSGGLAGEARAALRRLFPSIVLLGKQSRFVSLYEVKVVPGVLYAQASSTPPVDETPITLHFRVSTTARRPVVWTIEQLPEEKLKAA